MASQGFCGCSVEVWRNTGYMLGGTEYDADDENRGVVRNELILALADQLPKGSLHLGTSLQSVSFDEHGDLCSYLARPGAVCNIHD